MQEKRNEGSLYVRYHKPTFPFAENPLSEYPRMTLVRESYLSLNGVYGFARQKKEELPLSYPERILVPYAVESPLSGIEELVEPDDILFYQRTVSLPAGFRKKRILLHFDGVDQDCEVFIDGRKIGEHHGGYTRFQFELPENVPDTFLLQVKVKDQTDSSFRTTGKQRLKTTGWFYTSSSGIVFPVWLESVPLSYVESVSFRPCPDLRHVEVFVQAVGEGKVTLAFGGKEYAVKANEKAVLEIENPHLWSPEDPYLYDVQGTFDEDSFRSYFGLRWIEEKKGEDGKWRLLLNGKPLFLSAVLDQGYYFEGNLTPKSYDDYVDDLERLKSLGFNAVRKHVKIEEDRFYYEADRRGMLVLQDFPNGGRHVPLKHVVLPKFLPKKTYSDVPDPYPYFGRQDEEGRKEWNEEMETWMEELGNHPSIILYTIFNEGWGEFDPDEHYRKAKALDPTRLYDTASGWYAPHPENTDFVSIHTYDTPHKVRKDYDRPFLLSEVGGIGLYVQGHVFFDGKTYGHKKQRSDEGLSKKLLWLYEPFLRYARNHDLVGIVYTQLSDCERERNGIYTFDRKVLKGSEATWKDINRKLLESVGK